MKEYQKGRSDESQDKKHQTEAGIFLLSCLLGSVTQACKVVGYSRDSFYRFKKFYEEGGELALRDIVRLNRPNPKNRVDPEIESRVVKIALDNPALGQQRVSNELRKEGGEIHFKDVWDGSVPVLYIKVFKIFNNVTK